MLKDYLYAIIMAVLLIVAFFTGEIVTYTVLLLIYMLLNNMHKTMQENQKLLEKSIQLQQEKKNTLD